MENSHPGITTLCQVNKQITLHDITLVTVPVFDARGMIMDILTNNELMNQENIADGYDIFTGDVDENHESNRNYGEIHTGDAWLPARNRFCPRINGPSMPVALIVFGDKSHTDLHGTLALTPVIFTLTLFNRTARNNTKFWRPFGYMQICRTIVEQLIVVSPKIKYKTSIPVCLFYLRYRLRLGSSQRISAACPRPSLPQWRGSAGPPLLWQQRIRGTMP